MPDFPADSAPLEQYCICVADLSVALQRAAGHRVSHRATFAAPDGGSCRLVYEYEHGDTGADAGEIAAWALSAHLPGLAWDRGEPLPGDTPLEAARLLLNRAAQTVLPVDAEALIDAAARADIPTVKLEREPYQGLEGAFRIRPHGLLKLGYACHQRILDGTLCLDRSAALVPLLFDRAQRHAALRSLGLPVPDQEGGAQALTMTRHLLRAAGRIGYPVVLKTVRRRVADRVETARPPLADDSAVRVAADRLRAGGSPLLVERYVPGSTWRVLLANGEVVCIFGPDGASAADALHPDIVRQCREAAGRLDCGLLCFTLVTEDPGLPLEVTGGAFVALDPAPRLDRLLPDAPDLLARAADGFIAWLYPRCEPSRIPLLAVTGTNGKTTTSRMLARIATEAGYRTGLASTAGVYIDSELRKAGDLAGLTGHHLLFESREIDFGVLEVARGAIAHSGFMYDRSDVGVCLNVTADHIGEFGVDTLQDMVQIKRSVLARARRAVVLNADYPTCLDMLPFAPGVRVALCSLTSSGEALLPRAGADGCACVIESDGAREWLVWYEGGRRQPILPVDALPAAQGGAARFNVSNAQHATAAALMQGLETDAVARALAGFDSTFENNPGRLNVYRGHPFTVIMDYAHNPDGMQQLLDTVDRMSPGARRILLYAGTGNRSDEEIAAHTRFPVGRIDHYVVRRYPGLTRGRGEEEVPLLMREVLLEAGVPERDVTLAIPPTEGVRIALGLARPGDVVIVSPGSKEFETMWKEVVSFVPDQEGG